MDGNSSKSSRRGHRVESSLMKRLAMGQMTTPEYNEWWVRRINDNTPKPS
ncbi:hypothetical protein Goklo_025077 [Gossypium klotzschianum]|uniref:Uncharacterized protein n=1 Tax=Gossypium klotzschianum TaxID=34286 RepID=A0A7J8WCX5_9ROSI|nr:hypothetical protein [Gossypium klotzschianum]